MAIIEDAACAIGTTYKGKPVGGLADVGCFSFHPRKIVTTGEGGAVTTQDDEIAKAVRSLRNHGATGPQSPPREQEGPWTMSTFDRLGYNLRLSDIQAAVGIAQMAKLRRSAGRARRLAAGYRERLSEPTRYRSSGSRMPDTAISHSSFASPKAAAADAMPLCRRSPRTIFSRPGTHAVPGLGYYREKYGIRIQDFQCAVLAEDRYGRATLRSWFVNPGFKVEREMSIKAQHYLEGVRS